MVVAIGLHNQQINNFRKEQHQNAKWSGLSSDVCCFIAFPFGSPHKGVHYTPLRIRRQCPLHGLWLMTCHIPNSILIFRGAGGIIQAGRRLWTGRPSRHLFILCIRYIIFRTITVRNRNTFISLVHMEQTRPFRWRSFITLHLANKAITSKLFRNKFSDDFRRLS